MRVYRDGAGLRGYLAEVQAILDAMKSVANVDLDAYKDLKRRLRDKLNDSK